MSTLLDEARLTLALERTRYGSPRKVLGTTGSTNDDALSWASEGAPEGALVVADHQTAGRGRKGRTWLSEPGHALLFSLVLRPPSTQKLALVSTVLGVGACEALRRLTNLSVLLKWPNDLMVDDRKLAGILVETRSAPDSAPVAVAGMGVNVSWGASSLPSDVARGATSVTAEMQRSGLLDPPERETLLAALVQDIERRYDQLLAGGAEDLVTTAESLSSLVGREVVVRVPAGDPVAGMVTGLAPDGGLEVVTAGGLEVLTAGEVETVRRA